MAIPTAFNINKILGVPGPTGPQGPPGTSQVERLPTQMAFVEVFKRAWVTDSTTTDYLFPPALKWVTDDFSDTSTARFTQTTESTAGTLAISGGGATITQTNSPASAHMNLEAEGVAIGMPEALVAVDVLSKSGPSGGYLDALLGFVKDSNNYIVANWNLITNVCQLQVKVTGSSTFTSTNSLSLPVGGMKLAVSVVGNRVTVYSLDLAAASNLWEKVLVYDLTPQIDFKAEDHSLWYGCFGMATPGTQGGTNTVRFDNFHVGRFGGVGIRDICVVTNEDGTPNNQGLPDSQVYATATIAGAEGDGSSFGVFIIDLEKKSMTQTGLIMVSRSGKVQNDNAGHMILYANGDQRLTISSWGDAPTPNPTRILHKLETAATNNFLTGARVVSGMSVLALTELPASGGQYDPYLIKANSRWYIAYVASDPSVAYRFYPALDISSDLVTWTNVGKDDSTAALRHEGTRILKFANAHYVLVGGNYDMRMYDIAMVYVGIVNVLPPGAGVTQPHAMIFPYEGLNLLLTFDEAVWPVSTGSANSWGNLRWFASPRY